MNRRLWLVFVGSVFSLAILGCGKLTEKASSETAASPTTQVATPVTPSQTSTTASAPMPAAPGSVAQPVAAPIASAAYSADPAIRCDLLEVKRVSGNALLVRWRLFNTGTASKKIEYSFNWNELYYVDPLENKKYEYLKDSDGNRILDVFMGYMGAGESRTNWAKFPAPPAGSSKISVTIPKFPPFEDVPVAQ